MSENSNSANFKNALCYVPLLAFVLFFTEDNKSPTLLKNIKYGMGLFVLYIVLDIFMRWFGLSGVLGFMYILASGFLGYRAYTGEDIEIEGMDVFEDKVKQGFKTK